MTREPIYYDTTWHRDEAIRRISELKDQSAELTREREIWREEL